jgi:hypothetical protein
MDRAEITVLKWIATAGITCAFLVINLFTPLLDNVFFFDEWLFLIAVAICVAQINLIATWAALAPGNIMLRLPWSLLLAVLMWYSLVLGNRIESHFFDRDEAIVLGMIILIAVVVAQVPLWIAGKALGWQLASWANQTQRSATSEFQFHLRHVLLGMVFLSLALAPLRFVLPTGEVESPHLERELWVLLPAAAICNLLITVPCIWGAFIKAEYLVPLGCGWLIYCGVLSAVELGVLTMFLGPPGEPEAIAMIFVFNATQCAVVLGTLLVFRALGFRLLRVRWNPDAPQQLTGDANNEAPSPGADPEEESAR